MGAEIIETPPPTIWGNPEHFLQGIVGIPQPKETLTALRGSSETLQRLVTSPLDANGIEMGLLQNLQNNPHFKDIPQIADLIAFYSDSRFVSQEQYQIPELARLAKDHPASASIDVLTINGGDAIRLEYLIRCSRLQDLLVKLGITKERQLLTRNRLTFNPGDEVRLADFQPKDLVAITDYRGREIRVELPNDYSPVVQYGLEVILPDGQRGQKYGKDSVPSCQVVTVKGANENETRELHNLVGTPFEIYVVRPQIPGMVRAVGRIDGNTITCVPKNAPNQGDYSESAAGRLAFLDSKKQPITTFRISDINITPNNRGEVLELQAQEHRIQKAKSDVLARVVFDDQGVGRLDRNGYEIKIVRKGNEIAYVRIYQHGSKTFEEYRLGGQYNLEQEPRKVTYQQRDAGDWVALPGKGRDGQPDFSGKGTPIYLDNIASVFETVSSLINAPDLH